MLCDQFSNDYEIKLKFIQLLSYFSLISWMGCFLVLAEVSRFYFPTNFTMVLFSGVQLKFAIVQLVSGKRENRSGILARDRSVSDT